MKILFRVTFILVVVFLALALPVRALAAGQQSPLPDRIVIGESYVLESGEVLEGDIWLMGGNVTLEADSTVTGDVLVMGGSLEVDGLIEGEITAMGGMVFLRQHAVVEGDVNMVGGSLERADGAQVGGEVNTASSGPYRFTTPLGSMRLPRFEVALHPFWQAVQFFMWAFVAAALAVLVVMFVPKPVERVAHAVISQPVIAGGLGLLTLLVAAVVLPILTLTICLAPLTVLAAIVLLLAVVYGWIALGTEVGQRMGQMFKVQWTLPVSAVLGTLFMTLVVNAIGLIDCFGWIAPGLVIILGLGGTMLTYFGKREYVRATVPLSVVGPSAPVPPQAPESPSAPEPPQA